jgi:hypothetical protein
MLASELRREPRIAKEVETSAQELIEERERLLNSIRADGRRTRPARTAPAEAAAALRDAWSPSRVMESASKFSRSIDAALAVLDAMAETDEVAERALPSCVHELRRAWREGDHANPLSASIPFGAACLSWLATAPAYSLARLALGGDALKAVRRWCSGADVLDADAVAPLLREAFAWHNDFKESDLGPGQTRILWRAIAALSPEWKKLGEERPK